MTELLPRSSRRVVIGLLAMWSLGMTAHAAPPEDAARRAADQQALAPLQGLIGTWRGAGQPKRGSTEGAWVERGEWIWDFSGGRAALRWKSPDAKYAATARLQPGEKPGEFQLDVTHAENQPPVRYHGQQSEEETLVFTSDEVPAGQPERCSLRLVAQGDRLVARYERRSPAGEGFTRLAEIGYTRQGSRFGKGTTMRECVVTGGQGTIPVMHEGQTYYVCCTGCRDVFQMDPAAVLAEYRERKSR